MGEKSDKHNNENRPIIPNHIPQHLEGEIEVKPNMIEHLQRFIVFWQTEPNSGKRDEIKGDKNLPEMDNPPTAILIRRNSFPIIVNHQSRSIHHSPNHEVLSRTMPESTNNHCDQEIEIPVHVFFEIRTYQNPNNVERHEPEINENEFVPPRNEGEKHKYDQCHDVRSNTSFLISSEWNIQVTPQPRSE